MAYIALLFLPAAYLLGYPLNWLIERVLVEPARRLVAKRYEWDAAYRD